MYINIYLRKAQWAKDCGFVTYYTDNLYHVTFIRESFEKEKLWQEKR